MFYNRQIRAMSVALVLLLAVFSAIAFFAFGRAACLFTFFCFLFLSLIFYLFTASRYREIARLSRRLHEIAAGNFALDLRDNVEGELSVLKCDIFKVTTMLAKQGERASLDRELLADALSDISHQLKTPLTSMVIMTDILSESGLSEERRLEFSSELRTQLERLDWLLSTLLKLSKIDSHTAQFSALPVRCKAVVEKAVGIFEIALELRGQTLSISCDESEFIGDFEWSCEALTNIVKNCIEHTPRGGTIEISCEETPIFTKISVCDSGEGIEKSEISKIFKRFYRGKNAAPDSVGIGLALAKKIMLSQGGDLTAGSRADAKSGSLFEMKFYKTSV